MGEADPEITQDRLLGGRVHLLQPRRGHRAGTDAVLLAAMSPVRAGAVIVDLGAGTGAVGLMLARRSEGARIVLVEREPDLVLLARRNLALNGLEDRGRAVEADVFSPPAVLAQAGLPLGAADLVATNPPFFDEGEGRPSPERARRSAHHMAGGSIEGWMRTAAALLKPQGRATLIHRADALAVCLAALVPRFGSLTITPIHPRTGERASRVVITGLKGGRGPLTIEAPLVLHDADGAFTPEAVRLHGSPLDTKEAPESASPSR